MRIAAPRQDAVHSRAGGQPSKLSAGFIVALTLSLMPGCRRDEITHFRVPKEGPGPSPAAVRGMADPQDAPAAAPGGELPAPPTPAGASGLKWTLPKGWTESLAGGMRYATLKPPNAGRIDVSVIVLPGPAGGELANVNRWRGQIGLTPIDEPALASARKTIRTKAGKVLIYDFTSEGQKRSRVVAGLAFADDNTWFIKMAGDEDSVGVAKPDFIHLLESLRFEAATN